MFVWVWIFLKTHTNIINNKKNTVSGFIFVRIGICFCVIKQYWWWYKITLALQPCSLLLHFIFVPDLFLLSHTYKNKLRNKFESNENHYIVVNHPTWKDYLCLITLNTRFIIKYYNHTYIQWFYIFPPSHPTFSKKKTIYFWNKWNGLINIFSLTFVCEKLMADAFFNPKKNTKQYKISFHTPFWVQWSKYRMNEYFTQ